MQQIIHSYLFCVQKAYAVKGCLVISNSTLWKLSTEPVPISRAVWLKVAFVSTIRSLPVNVYFRGSVLIPWPSKALSNLTFQTSLSYDPLSLSPGVLWHLIAMYLFSFSTFSSGLSRSLNQGRLDPNFLLDNFHVWWFLHESWIVAISAICRK